MPANAIKSDKASMMIELPPVDSEQIPAWRVSPLTEVVACGLRPLKWHSKYFRIKGSECCEKVPSGRDKKHENQSIKISHFAAPSPDQSGGKEWK